LDWVCKGHEHVDFIAEYYQDKDPEFKKKFDEAKESKKKGA
jgi:hypothetical protein